eukprot:1001268-Pyramimonas_sp.AAC.1
MAHPATCLVPKPSPRSLMPPSRTVAGSSEPANSLATPPSRKITAAPSAWSGSSRARAHHTTCRDQCLNGWNLCHLLAHA